MLLNNSESTNHHCVLPTGVWRTHAIVGIFMLLLPMLASAMTFRSVGGGYGFGLAVRSEGTLWAWGDNVYGQLGDGTKTASANPEQIGTGTAWATVGVGYQFTCATKTDGTLWCWGSNGYGQVGNGSAGGSGVTTPTQVGTDTHWAAVQGGYYFTCGLKTDGTLWCWGDNQWGQIGDGTNTQRTIPVQVSTAGCSTWKSFAVGSYHALGICSDNSLWAWGRNLYQTGPNGGMLGDGTTTNQNAPEHIGTSTWSAISAGFTSSVGIRSDGTLWSWGGSHQGELCQGDLVNRLVPTQIGSAGGWTSISAKNDTTHAIDGTGALWGCGSNADGQLGTGGASTYVLTRIGTETRWKKVWQGWYTTPAFTADNSLWDWGLDAQGQVGDGGTTNVTAPKQIMGVTHSVGTGKDYSTIQACATAASAGWTCLVYPGTYGENVTVSASGSAGQPIIFQSYGIGAAYSQRFNVTGAYVTVDGFDLSGYTVDYTGMIDIGVNANYATITNNKLHGNNGTNRINAVRLEYTTAGGGHAASNSVVSNNTISDLNYIGILLNGSNHLVSYNTFSLMHQWDIFYIFGTGHTITHNFVSNPGTVGAGNHPDYFQTFGSSGQPVQNITISYNWIQDLPEQLCQLNSSVNGVGTLATNIGNFTFLGNVILNVPANCNLDIPNTRWQNNTFYRMAYNMTGIIVGGSLTRGNGAGTTFINNVFLDGGFYYVDGFLLTGEVIGTNVTGESTSGCTSATCPIAYGIAADMVSNSYIDGNTNGHILAAARALASESDMKLNSSYTAYKDALWTTLQTSITYDNTLKSGFLADYNYTAASATGYPARSSSSCNCSLTYTSGKFCEAVCGHGINGGDPQFQNVSNPLGPDNLPFTADDGFIPLAGSPLCGKGLGGSDIGAYSCNLATSLSQNGPLPPTSLTVVVR